jgi:hypothetical protein
LPEAFFDLACDIRPGKAEIGESAIVELAQMAALADPPVPFEERGETNCQQP